MFSKHSDYHLFEILWTLGVKCGLARLLREYQQYIFVTKQDLGTYIYCVKYL